MDTRLKTVRQARGWSQSRLVLELERLGEARGVGVATRASLKTAVSRWENGHVTPDPVYSGLLAEIYATSPAELGLLPEQPVLWVPPAANGAQISADYLEAMADLLGGYAKADNAVGSGHLLAIVSQHVAHLEQGALAARHGLRDEAFKACSRFAEFAGWLCQDSADLHQAEHWTQRALDYLEVVGDDAGRAYLLMRKAAVAAERKEFTRSVSLALAAEQSVRDQSPQLAALVLRQAAIAHALANDEVASERAVELALGRIEGCRPRGLALVLLLAGVCPDGSRSRRCKETSVRAGLGSVDQGGDQLARRLRARSRPVPGSGGLGRSCAGQSGSGRRPRRAGSGGGQCGEFGQNSSRAAKP
jgi:transcriptional regulator with XRE-family HTH domain